MHTEDVGIRASSLSVGELQSTLLDGVEIIDKVTKEKARGVPYAETAILIFSKHELRMFISFLKVEL